MPDEISYNPQTQERPRVDVPGYWRDVVVDDCKAQTCKSLYEPSGYFDNSGNSYPHTYRVKRIFVPE